MKFFFPKKAAKKAEKERKAAIARKKLLDQIRAQEQARAEVQARAQTESLKTTQESVEEIKCSKRKGSLNKVNTVGAGIPNTFRI